MTKASLQQDTESLLDWYDKNRRVLPWREDPTPYHIWVSEIMLQQTRVDAVIPYYLRFMEILPDVASLAEADEETYLKLWEGLGYYSRVRNMHKAAVQVMEEFGGQIPSTVEELQSLSGIGKYTAEAIASIAFGIPVPSVDGNLLRVFSRRECYPENIKSSEALKAAESFYAERISSRRPGDYNQAVMDLGATICLPNGAPLCEQCPWSGLCTSHAKGNEIQYPVLPPKKKRVVSKHTVLLFRTNGRVILEHRSDDGLLSGLIGFPMMDGHLRAEDILLLLSEHHIPAVSATMIKEYKHVFSHREWLNRIIEIRLSDHDLDVLRSTDLFKETELICAEIPELQDRYSIPTAFRPCAEHLL